MCGKEKQNEIGKCRERNRFQFYRLDVREHRMCSLNASRSSNLAPVEAGIIHLLVNEIFPVVIQAETTRSIPSYHCSKHR